MSTRLGPTHPRAKKKPDLVLPKRGTTTACFSTSMVDAVVGIARRGEQVLT